MESTFDILLKSANQHLVNIYVERMQLDPASVPYMAPEQLPQIYSRQILAVMRAVADMMDALGKIAVI